MEVQETMPSPNEVQRRKQLKRKVRQEQRDRLNSGMPLPREALEALFDHLDTSLAQGCDHTLAHTRAFLDARGLPSEAIVPWLVEQGGGCDCEVLANVEEQFS